MIKYDYMIERNEGNEFTTFTPNLIPKELPPLVYIEGPNSSGKSTLLNLIALAFDGNNRMDINENLRNKINALIDHSYQNISFDLKINVHEEELVFNKNSGKTNILRSIIKANRELLLSTDQISEKYNLIYDIPENPITRLSEMNNILKLEHKKLENSAQEVLNIFRQIQTEVKNSQDPERIMCLEKEHNEQILQYQKNKREVEKESENINRTAQFIYTRAHRKSSYELSQIDLKIVKLSKSIKTVQKKKNRSNELLENEMFDVKKRLNRDVGNVVRLLKMIKYSSSRILEFENISFSPIKETAIIPQKYFSLINDTLSSLNKVDRSESKKIQAKISAFSELSAVLEKYQFDDIELPGEKTSIKQLLLNLRREIDKENLENESLLAIDDAVDYLNDLLKTLDYINDFIIPRYSKILHSKDDDEAFDNSDEQDLEKLYDKQKKLKKKVNDLSEKCISYNVNLTDDESIRSALYGISMIKDGELIRKNSDDENIKYLQNLNQSLEQRIGKLKTQEQVINRDKLELDHLRQMERHPLHGKSEVIDVIIGKLINTKTQLVTFNEYLERMKCTNDPSKKSEFDQYFESVANHLGKQIGAIRHIEKSHDIKKIDLINKQIVTKENKVIRFNDMGTGQSQAAYLLSKLSTLDHRKVVVLFDEIAMMDKSSLLPVFKRIIDLYNEEKLICAIVVQKAEVIRVVPLSEAL